MLNQVQPPDSAEIAGGTVESPDGTLLAYLRVGSGPALVVCHGSFASAQDWLPFAMEMADTHTVFLYDRRGRGSSPYLTPTFAVDAEVDDLASMLEIAGPGAALFGHSFGGGCALSCAARERFGGPVIVYEPRHSIDGPISAGHIPEIRRLLADGERELAVRAILEKVIQLPESATSFVDSPLWERMLQTVDAFPDELRLLDHLAWHPGDLDAIAGPTWLLVGEQSPVLPADREGALHDVLPNMQKTTLPGQGHFSYMSAPAELARAVRECLEASAPVFATEKDKHER